MYDGPQVQSAFPIPTGDDGTYEDILPSFSNSSMLGPSLDYFDFDYPIQPNYSYPIAFPPDAALSTPLSPHIAQLYDYTALYNGQPPMDLNLLSSQSYSEVPYEKTDPIEPEGGNTPLYGGLIPTGPRSGDASSTRATRPVRSRKSSKREDPTSMSPDESTAARQRGRPRLDTRDQTAAEVSLLGICQIEPSEADLPSVVVPRLDWLSGRIGNEKRRPSPASTSGFRSWSVRLMR